MVSDSIRWELPSEKCIEIIHLTLIDILSDNKENPMLINRLVQLLNQKTNTYKLHKNKRYNLKKLILIFRIMLLSVPHMF